MEVDEALPGVPMDGMACRAKLGYTMNVCRLRR